MLTIEFSLSNNNTIENKWSDSINRPADLVKIIIRPNVGDYQEGSQGCEEDCSNELEAGDVVEGLSGNHKSVKDLSIDKITTMYLVSSSPEFGYSISINPTETLIAHTRKKRTEK